MLEGQLFVMLSIQNQELIFMKSFTFVFSAVFGKAISKKKMDILFKA